MKASDKIEIVKINYSYKKLIPKYITSRKNDLIVLKNLLDKNKFDELKSIAHKIKGSGSMYGFEVMSFIAKNIEEEAKCNNKELIKEYIKEMEDYLNNIQIVYE